jgi:DNA primase
VANTVASSGTAFTQAHLERLKRLSSRLILAFDGDEAGQKAAEKSTVLALNLGMEVKVAELPLGKDPADLAREDSEKWKDVLRESKHAIEIFLGDILKSESDPRKIGKAVEKKILPLIALLSSSIERAHFVSVIAKRAGIREEIIWEDLKRAKAPQVALNAVRQESEEEGAVLAVRPTRSDELEEAMRWLKDNADNQEIVKKIQELQKLIKIDELSTRIATLERRLANGEAEVWQGARLRHL